MEIYSYRKNQPSIVRCLGAESLQAKNKTMCGNEQTLKVLTERIPKRWSELPQLTFPETLYGLNESLKGFEDLHNKAGVFDIGSNMIGVNNNGEVKVWLNENFAENHPAFEKPVLQTTLTSMDSYMTPSSESQMVRSVIDIIEDKCENGRFPNDFRDRLHKNSRTFDEAINVTENYIKSGGVFVPDRINMVGIEDTNIGARSSTSGARQISTFQSGVPLASTTYGANYTADRANQAISSSQSGVPAGGYSAYEYNETRGGTNAISNGNYGATTSSNYPTPAYNTFILPGSGAEQRPAIEPTYNGVGPKDESHWRDESYSFSTSKPHQTVTSHYTTSNVPTSYQFTHQPANNTTGYATYTSNNYIQPSSTNTNTYTTGAFNQQPYSANTANTYTYTSSSYNQPIAYSGSTQGVKFNGQTVIPSSGAYDVNGHQRLFEGYARGETYGGYARGETYGGEGQGFVLKDKIETSQVTKQY